MRMRIDLLLAATVLLETMVWAGGGEFSVEVRPPVFQFDRLGGAWVTEDFPDMPEMTERDLFFDVVPRSNWARVMEIGSSLFWGPERFLGWMVEGASLVPSSGGICAQFFDGLKGVEGEGRTFDHFFENLLVREQESLHGFAREGKIDPQEIWERQRKMVGGALGDAFLGRFRRAFEEGARIAYDFDRWEGADYVLAPALMAGTLYLGGIRSGWTLGDASGRFELTPLQQILEQGKREDLTAALAIGVGLGRSPILLVVAMGLQDGDPELDFVGIGTGLGEVRELLREAA